MLYNNTSNGLLSKQMVGNFRMIILKCHNTVYNLPPVLVASNAHNMIRWEYDVRNLVYVKDIFRQ